MDDDLFRIAVSQIKAGNIGHGKSILISLLTKKPRHAAAWAWLYFCVIPKEDKLYCLKNIIQLHPNHTIAKAELKKLVNNRNVSIPSVSATRLLPPQYMYKPLLRQNTVKPYNINNQIPKKKNVFLRLKPSKVRPKIFTIKVEENLYTEIKVKQTDFPEFNSAMVGTRLSIGGILITAHDHPKCIDLGRIPHKSQCQVCNFFSESDCPIQKDQTILLETKTLFAQNTRRWQELRDRRDEIVETIYSELKSHGRPLHYEVIAQIMKDRHTRFHLNGTKVLRYMSWHPEKFEWVNSGVYRAK